MKKQILHLSLIFCLICTFSEKAFSEDRDKWLSIDSGEDIIHKIAIGGKWHTDYANSDDLPIEEDDYSCLIFYELHNNFAYWQLGGAFTPGPDDDRFDHIITPQLNLIIKDRIYRVGIGAMKSNVKADGHSNWAGTCWQVIFGLGIPLGSHFGIDIYGHYLFESWEKIEEPVTEAPEISLMISFSF